jgi:gas vesicle protein
LHDGETCSLQRSAFPPKSEPVNRNAPIVTGLSLGLLLCLSGCKEKTTAEKVGDSVAKAADTTKEATKDASNATKDTFQEIGNDLKKVGEDIADGAKKAYDETKEAVKDATKK